jgi:hypothetical protein
VRDANRDEPSRLQTRIATAMRAAAGDFEPDLDADFTVYLQAEASAMLLWRSWHGGMYEPVGLSEVLCEPDRAGLWDIDSGEAFEAGFSDSAFASDRSFGYVLAPWCDAWGPEEGPHDHLSDDASDSDYFDADAAYDVRTSCAAGTLRGWVSDAEAMLAYATVRHFLRTLRWREHVDLSDAARELFVRDLRDQPRGLRRFSAMVSCVDSGE